FCITADARFGSITKIRQNGTVKEIKWRAFKLQDSDWERVLELIEILKDVQRIQQIFSSETLPTLWRAIPVFERLQTAWEKKRDDERFELYVPGLDRAYMLWKKYYCMFDDKPVFLLAIFLHPYFKLDYIVKAWGGKEDQLNEQAEGVRNAKNWRQEAERVIQATVRSYY
ncbi:hypothetical protein SISNIDRAFT_420903, partial [Sistotremastrum niveocremeum HHB9708]